MREDRFWGQDTVVDKYHAPLNVDYTMNVRDYVLRPRALTQDIIITLPPVAEARGRFYSIVAEDLDNEIAIGTNWITITHAGDSEVWAADVILKEKGRGHLFYSDGMKWVSEAWGDITHESSQVFGNINLRSVNLTVSAIGTGVVNIEAFKSTLTSSVKSGAWANAITGLINYAGGGAAHGMAASICADMIPPDSSLERGSLYCLDLAMGPGVSSSWGSAGPVAFMNFQNYGTQAYFDDNAYFFRLARVLEGVGHLLSVNAQTMRVLIDGHIAGKERFVVLSDSENILDHNVTTVVSGSYGMRSKATITDGHSEGVAGYFEGHIAGTPDNNCYAVGAWMNIDGVTGGFNIRALDVGIYTTQNLGGVGTIYGMNIGIHLGGAGAPGTAYQMRFNHSGHALTAWFHASNAGAVAYTAGDPGGDGATGKICVHIGGATMYIPLYV